MSKSAVIYWSGTGNTEAMAQAVLDGLNGAGEDAALFSADSVRAADAAQYDKLALGCPAMGAEVLEESVFEPFFTELEPLLSGKKVALFGSYGWGDGQWMRDWQDLSLIHICPAPQVLSPATPSCPFAQRTTVLTFGGSSYWRRAFSTSCGVYGSALSIKPFPARHSPKPAASVTAAACTPVRAPLSCGLK